MYGALMEIARGGRQWQISYKMGLQDISLRYKRSVLGPFWISASLVVSVIALAYVFSDVFQHDLRDHVGFVAGGLLAWQLIAALTNESCQCIIEHTAYLKNVPLPLSVMAGRVVFRNAVIFTHNLAAIVCVLLLFGIPITPMVLLIIPGIALILLLGFFLAMLMGPVCARFRDVPQAVQSMLQVIFFLTPIFWQPLPGAHRPIFTTVNPFYHLVELVRAPLLGYGATLFDWQFSLFACLGVVTLSLVSVAVTRKRVMLWL